MTASRPDVLITSASRKVPLVRAFRAACAAVGGGRVLAADVSPQAVALYEADAGHLIPRTDDPGFVDGLLALCERERIGLVVPTRDAELPIFAAAAPRFREAGTLVLVSSPEAVAACQDKRAFLDAVAAAGLDAPRLVDDPGPGDFPVFVKPRRGAGARGAGLATDGGALAAMRDDLGADAIVQEVIEAPEYTIDTFLDLDARPISCVPRERIAVVAGESVVTRTVADDGLVDATLRLCTSIGLVGHVTVQAFRSPDRVAFIEINPRYGGAANLGFEAGSRTPEDAIRLARGETVEPRLGQYEAGLTMLRYSTDRFVRDADLLAP
jgi:carbamoyl-phosphate synthase large subunit